MTEPLTGLLIPATGSPRRVVQPDGLGVLDWLQSCVGGMIEVVPGPEHLSAYCNEEGKLDGLKPNEIATALFFHWLMRSDVLVGDVIVLGPLDEEGDETSIPLSESEWAVIDASLSVDAVVDILLGLLTPGVSSPA